MVQIVEEYREPSFMDRLMEGFGAASRSLSETIPQRLMQQQQERRSKSAYKNLIDQDVSGLPPEERKAVVTELLKRKGKEQLLLSQQDFLNQLFGGKKEQIPSEFSDRIQDTVDEKQFDHSSLSDEAIIQANIINPHLGKALQKQKDIGLREKREGEKLKFKKEQTQKKEEIAFHQESKDYDEKILDSYKKSINQIESIKNIEEALKSGKVKPTSAVNILRGMGTIGDKIANAILNKDQATVLSSIPYLIEGWKDVFGVRLSDKDLQLIQDKLPDIGKSEEANFAILNVMKKYAQMSKLRHQIAQEIKKQNKGLRPLGYADKVETKFQDMMQPVKVINPHNGNLIEIPAYQVSDAIKSGATLYNE